MVCASLRLLSLRYAVHSSHIDRAEQVSKAASTTDGATDIDSDICTITLAQRERLNLAKN